MSSTLKNVITKAYQMFKLKNTPVTPTATADSNQADKFASDLHSLSESMSTLNADTVNLHQLIDRIPSSHKKPITFIHVCENAVMCGVIIVMQPGTGIPLHDHPGMYGLIKVLHGQLRVRTYTATGDLNPNRIQPAIRSPDMILSRVSETQILTPTSRNVHQIECISGEGDKEYAAFLDILSPPYHDDIGCHYYRTDESDPRKSHTENQIKCSLIETDCPKDYFCSSVYL